MASSIRRIVTGKDKTGKAVVVVDGAATSVHSRPETGVTNTLLWATDSIPADLTDPSDSGAKKIGVVPPANGTIFRIVEFTAEKQITADYETRLRLIRSLGLAREGPSRDHPRHPGMHRTRTVDYAVIISGEIDLLLDDTDVHLKAGDVVVQCGTNHAWVNRGALQNCVCSDRFER